MGIMIQGATRKVTLSVKTDTSERGWGRGALSGSVGSWVPALSPDTGLVLNLPVYPPG